MFHRRSAMDGYVRPTIEQQDFFDSAGIERFPDKPLGGLRVRIPGRGVLRYLRSRLSDFRPVLR